ncbi:MAG TPA: SusC/RagA family TonB-linked outer membrane protein [Puia sp.]
MNAVRFTKLLQLPLFIFLLFCVPAVAQSQDRSDITGVVWNEKGIAMPNVTVMVTNKKNNFSAGVQTDSAGVFSFSRLASGKGYQFTFSHIGFETQTISNYDLKPNGRFSLVIKLKEADPSLNEVVVVGYGTQKRRDLTGAVVSADIKSFSNTVNVSVIQSLQGMVPGLTVGQTTSAGEDPDLTMRGTRTINGGHAPLIVLDGAIYRGVLSDINPRDIESIDILKDASSTAVYGSQASNGVLLITSKSGQDLKKPIISYDGSYAWQNPAKVLHPMNATQFLKKNYDADWQNSQLAPDYTQPNPAYVNTHWLNQTIRQNYLNGVNTDWWGLLTRQASVEDHTLSIRGRTAQNSYFLSLGYTNQKDLIINDNFKRYSLRMNVENKITDWLTIGLRSFLTSADMSGASPDLRMMQILSPFAKPTDSTGKLIREPYWGGYLNPLLQITEQDYNKRLNLFGNATADVKIPWIKGLSYRLNYSNNYTTYKHYIFNPYGANYQGFGSKYVTPEEDWTLDNIVSYKHTFHRDHDLDVTLLYGREKRSAEDTYVQSSVFANPALGYNSLQAGDATQVYASSYAWEENSLYSMARLFYSYKHTYMITGTIRRDGFSGFGENNKYGVFPSVAGAWVISNEKFVHSLTWLNNLKLRASYGSNGNRTINRYQTLSQVNSGISYLYGDNASPALGQAVSNLPNPDLKWEKTTGVNLGIDFSVLDSRLTGNVEYFTTHTTDLLYSINIPQINGFPSTSTNIGQIDNHGVEFALTGHVVASKDFDWYVSPNFSLSRNKVVTIFGKGDQGHQGDLIASGIFIGQPVHVWYDYTKTGMWQLADQAAGKIPSGFYPGTYKIADLNHDGVISPDKDRSILGYTDPGYSFGIKSQLRYKNFNLLVTINSIQGGKKYYYGNIAVQESNWFGGDNAYNSNNPGWDWWTPSNPNAKYPRLDQQANYSQTMNMQRNFVRLQDVILSYSIGNSLLAKAKMRTLRVYVSGKNLYTWTKWRGWDPETGGGLNTNVKPVMKSITAGINIEF